MGLLLTPILARQTVGCRARGQEPQAERGDSKAPGHCAQRPAPRSGLAAPVFLSDWFSATGSQRLDQGLQSRQLAGGVGDGDRQAQHAGGLLLRRKQHAGG